MRKVIVDLFVVRPSVTNQLEKVKEDRKMRGKILGVISITMVLVLSLSLVAITPAGKARAEDPPVCLVAPWQLTTKNADSTAEWSTAQVKSGGYAVHLDSGTTTAGEGDEARIRIEISEDKTLNDITSISWYEYLVAGYPPHVDVMIDIDGDGEEDDALVFEYAYNSGSHYTEAPMPYGALTGAWYQTFSDDGNGPGVIDDSAYAWLTSQAAGPLGGGFGDNGHYGTTLGEWKAGKTTPPGDISGATTITALEIEVDNWVVNSEAYVDDIIVNGYPCYGLIQDAVDSADPGDVINVAPGIYNEQVVINKGLILQGYGDTTIIKPSQATADSFQLFARGTGGNDSAPIVVATTNGDTVSVQNLKIDGSLVSSVPGGASLFAGILYRDTAGLIDNVTVENIGAIYGGCGMYLVGHDTAVDVEVRNCSVSGYSKNGITANYPNITANIHDNTVTGMGPTDATAQNGIQIGYGATGTISINNVSGHVWTDTYGGSNDPATDPDADGACGILLYHPAGTVEIASNILTGNQFGIWSVGAASINAHDNNVTGLVHTGNAYPTGIVVSDSDMWSDDFGYTEVATTGAITQNTFTSHDYGVLVLDYTAGGALPAVSAGGNSFSNNHIHLVDTAGTLNMQDIWDTSTFDRAVVVDHPGASLLHTIWSSIQDGVDAANDNDTVKVAAGTYAEGITTIDQNLTIIGADAPGKPVIHPIQDTGTSNEIGAGGRGWFQVTGGAIVNFKNLVFDGAGKLVHTAVHYHGDSGGGTVEDCDFMNIAHTPAGYQGRGINNYGQHVEVLNCTFSNIYRIGVFTYNPTASTLISGCTYTGKGDGDWLDYGFEAGNGGEITVAGSTITNCKGVASVDGSTSAAILVTTYYGEGTQATINENTFTGNSGGIAVGYDEEDTSAVEAHYNNIEGNTDYGIDSTSTAASVNATLNWWGSANGPKHATTNPYSSGDEVSDDITYSPWLDAAYPEGNPREYNVKNITQDTTYNFIQAAIDAASDNDTINVLTGEYAGAIVDRAVKLYGAEDGTSVIVSGVPYKVDNDALHSAFRPEADGVEIRNFTINCDVSEDLDLGVYAIEVDDVTVDSLTINSDGTVQGITNWGGSDWVITNNTITNTVASGGGGIGIFVGAKAQQQCTGNLIQYNEVNATATAESYSCPGICLCLDTRYGQYDLLDGDEDISGNQILNNTITAAGANNGVGIEVGTILGNSEGDPDRTDPEKIAALMAAGALHDNTVQGNTINGACEGIYFYNVTGLTVTQNGISNNVNNGIYIEHAHSGTVIQSNDFTDNNVHVLDDSGTLDTEDVLANNTFDQTVVVDRDGASLLPAIWSSIQDAIDNAIDDDTVMVSAGSYSPFTVDTKTDLTIQSSGGAAVQGVQSVATAYTNRDCVVFVKNSSNVILDGLGIQGEDLGTINTKNYGVIYENSSGNMTACTVSPNNIGNMYSQAIGIWDGSEVTINDCQIEDFGRIGVFVYNGCTVEVLDSTIKGQVYGGEGEVCYGIEVEGAYNDATPGTGSQVVIRGNEIYNCDNTFIPEPSWTSAGIYINGWLEYFDEEDSAVIVENNNIHDNYIGITVIKSSSSYAHSNKIYDNRKYGVESVAAYNAETAVFDATGNYWGSATGPKQATTNPCASGDEVTANVDYTPWLDAADGAQRDYNVKNVTQDIKYNCIQSAIDDADESDTINVAAGTYNECLAVNKGVGIVGTGTSQVTVNVSGLAVNNAGIYVSADNVSLQGFTVLSDPTDTLPRYGIKFGEVSGGSVTDILVRDIFRSGFDFLGSANATISHVESRDNGGHGISLVDCNNITLSDITTSGSGWQAVSVATWGHYSPLGTSGIVFNGTNSFENVFQLEEGDFNNPGVAPAGEAIITYSTDITDGADVTVQAGEFGYALHGDQDDGPDQNRILFFETLADAQNVAPLAPVGHLLASGIYIESLTDRTQLYVSPGCEIQAAIDAANDDDTINAAPGTYTEAIAIGKPLKLRGATYGVNKNGYPVPAGYGWDDTVESIINHPDPAGGYLTIVDIVDTDDVTFEGFIVQELNAVGNQNSSLIRVRAQSDNVSNVVIRNNIIGPNTNVASQDGTHGRMGLYIVNNPYSDQYGVVNSTFSGNKIFDCQGNGNNIFLWSSYSNPAYGAPGPASMNGTVIEDNEIYGAHRSGIETAGGYSDLIIRNNKVYSNGNMFEGDAGNLKYGNGILLIRGSSDSHLEDNPGLGPEDLTIVDNEIYSNGKNAIYMGPINKDYTINGNKIYDNGWDGIRLDFTALYHNPDFEVGDRIPWSDQTEGVTAQFNSIYSNGEYGIRVVGEPTNGFLLNATNNWWGSKDETAVSSNVSDFVKYNPWIGADVTETKTEKTSTSNVTVDAKTEASTTVEKKGTGTPIITVAKYNSNPGTGFSGTTGNYIDVHADNVTDVEEIVITVYYTDDEISGLDESSLRLRWWNGTDWIVCSDGGVNTTNIPGPPAYSGYMWAKIRHDTIPSLDDLSGSVFAGGGSIQSITASGSGGGGAVGEPGTTDIRGLVTATGRFIKSVTATSEDNLCTLTIPRGTVGLISNLRPLTEITMLTMDEPPSPPEAAHIIGLAYDFCPDGVTFDPAITLTWKYDPGALPENVAEEDLVIAYYDEDAGKWVELDCAVDTENDTITALVSHFTTFAVIGTPEPELAPKHVPAPAPEPAPTPGLAPAPEPEPTPAPVPEPASEITPTPEPAESEPSLPAEQPEEELPSATRGWVIAVIILAALAVLVVAFIVIRSRTRVRG